MLPSGWASTGFSDPVGIFSLVGLITSITTYIHNYILAEPAHGGEMPTSNKLCARHSVGSG